MIAQCEYAALFLIVQEIIAFVQRANIPFSSRGSAASSLVAHCLGITNPDPLRLNLYFERFLNPARATPPDIDTDLCSVRRDEVLRFVFEQFGEDRVAMVSTINTFRERSALRESAKACGLPPAKISELVERLPYRWWGPSGDDERRAILSKSCARPSPQRKCTRRWISLPRFWDARATSRSTLAAWSYLPVRCTSSPPPR